MIDMCCPGQFVINMYSEKFMGRGLFDLGFILGET